MLPLGLLPGEWVLLQASLLVSGCSPWTSLLVSGCSSRPLSQWVFPVGLSSGGRALPLVESSLPVGSLHPGLCGHTQVPLGPGLHSSSTWPLPAFLEDRAGGPWEKARVLGKPPFLSEAPTPHEVSRLGEDEQYL